MDVREKLVELLNEMQDSGIVEIPAGFGFTKHYIENERIASHLIAHGVTVQEWISVKDRLPEKEQDVLVADNGFIAVWTFYGDYWEDSHGWWQEFDEVTHWMPLPEPPKGE